MGTPFRTAPPRVRALQAAALILLILCAPAFLSGCAILRPHHQAKPQDQKPATAVGYNPGPQRIGTIALVNTDQNFVLIDVGSLYSPRPGTALKSFASGAESGTESSVLAVTAEKDRPFIAADIIRGTPKVGDEVRE
jgi:hypothetical protein